VHSSFPKRRPEAGTGLSRQRLCLVAIAAAAIGIGPMLYLLWQGSGGEGLYGRAGTLIGLDFLAFYTGWTLALRDPAQLYKLHLQGALQGEWLHNPAFDGVYAFINPPAYALLFAPLALLPYRLAYLVWVLLGLAALALALWQLRPLVPRLRGERWLLAIGLALGFGPLFTVVSNGQNTLLSLLLHGLILRALLAGQDVRAGLLIGLGMLKPQLFLPLLPLALVRGRWRTLIGFTLSTGAQLGASLLWIGPAGLRGFVEVVSGPLSEQFASHAWQKFSWDAFFTLLFGHGDGGVGLLTLAACAITYGWLLWAWRYGRDLRLAYSATLFAVLLIIPKGSAYHHDLYLFMPAMVLTANDLFEHPASTASGRRREQVLIATLVLIYLLGSLVYLATYIGWQPVVLLSALASLLAALRLAPRPWQHIPPAARVADKHPAEFPDRR